VGTHSLKAPGFNHRSYQVKTRFQSLFLQIFNLYRYIKGVGDDAGKAKVLAPALRWALNGGSGGDRDALAVELLEMYSPVYAEGTEWGAAGGRKKGATGAAASSDEPSSWRVYLAALSAPAPAPARVAAMCRATPEFVGALPAAARAALLRRLFTAVGSDADAGARAAARDAVDALKLRADDVANLLRAASSATNDASAAAAAGMAEVAQSSPAAKRAKGGKAATAAADVEDGGFGARAAAAAATASAAIAALEVVGWKSAADVESRGELKAPCQELLASFLDAAAAFRGRDDDDDEDDEEDEEATAKKQPSTTAVAAAGEASSGYAQALVLTTLEMLARDDAAPATSAKTPSKAAKKGAASAAAAGAPWDVPLIVRAVQEAEAGPAREAALALLAAVAASDAQGVMDHVLEVSAALAHRAANASDDPLVGVGALFTTELFCNKRPAGIRPPGISMMLNSYCVRILTKLFVRFRVETTSSAAFLLRDANFFTFLCASVYAVSLFCSQNTNR
jgi:hypothetical protein